MSNLEEDKRKRTRGSTYEDSLMRRIYKVEEQL